MEKNNDYFLNLLNNPTFSADDFSQVGLSIDNTSLQDRNTYLNSNYIKELDIFQTNGSFDQSKFDNFYNYAKKGLSDLAKIKESEDIGNTWRAYRNDISMPENLRDNRPQFKIEKVKNPLRQQSGFVDFGLKENPTQSIREIAQSQLLEDYKTGELSESPNDTWWDNFLNPKVLATWDEDGTHTDPITGEIVNHKKGDRKLNDNGTYYYENLGNRDVYGKEVLSGFDTLTTDGSTWNKLDFLDSDDMEKSVGGSIMRAAAQIVPAFIPGVNTWYIGARVGLGMAQILPAVGKTLDSLVGIDTKNSIFNKLEAWDKALSFSQSDYTQGSQADDGQVISDSHLWSMETGLKLVADVFTQLAEQRWMFEFATSKFSGLSKDVISSSKAQTEWIENYIKNNSKAENIEEILMNGLSKGIDPLTTKRTIDAVNWARAQKVLEGKLKGAQELGSKLSMAYMTGITTASSYGEAKEAGASDLEAAIYTLGYTFGEWKLLNSELGKWILPELKSEERHIKNVVSKAMPKIKNATAESNTKTELGKAKWYQKLFKIGKNAYYNNLGQGIGSETLGATVSNMASEALEETSEELLQDVAKTLFNAGTSLVGSDTKFNDAFKNVFDRYALSFLGGAVGGGIAGYLPAYRSARFDRSMSQESATKELVDFIQQGKEEELISAVNKMTFGNKYLDEQGNQVDDETKSQDFQIKKNFARLVTDIKDVLTVNGANLDKDSLLKELGTQDIRYGMLASLAAEKSNAIEWYLNRYNDLSSQLVAKSLELKDLTGKQTDKEKREGNDDNSEKEKSLKEEIKNIKDELDKFKDGTMSDEFILDALFEMTSKISGVYIPTLEQTIKEETGKSIDQLTDSERKAWSEEYDNQRPVRRNLVRMARMLHIQNMEKLANILTDYNETYFKNPDEAINNLSEILFGHRQLVTSSPDVAVPLAQDYLAIYQDRINPMLREVQEAILSNLDESIAKPFADRIKTILDSPSTLAKQIGIDILPNTAEGLRSLDEDTKKKLLSAFGIDSYDNIDEVINEYIETKDQNGEQVEVLNNKFKKSVKGYENTLRSDLNSEFNILLRDFLQNKEVKQALINKLSSAKYILPTVKQALTDFFTANVPMLDEETYQYTLQPLISKNLAQEYIDSFKNKQSSPVDLYINNIVTTLKGQGIEISPLVANIDELVSKLSKAKNLETFSYTDEVEKIINDALKVLQYAKVGLDSAATTINGDLSDAFGFNVSVNEIRSRRDKKGQELATIPADVAEGIIQDINRYEQDLLFFKSLQAYNSNSILNEHDKTYQVQSLNLYSKLKNFVGHLETPDWNELDKLKLALEESSITEVFENMDSLGTDQESKEKLTEVRLKIDKAVHNFFKANESKLRGFKTKEDRNEAIKFLQKLLKDLKITYDPIKDTNTPINLEEKSFPDKDLLWYLASMAAADPEAVLNEYSEVISAQYAPIIGQEEAIRTTLSFLIDPKVFDLFADAYNQNILESNYDKKEFVFINAKRSIFIEGVPGSGKSSATLKTLTDILDKFHPNLLKNVVIVSNSKENSKRLVETLGMDSGKIQHFGIEEFRGKIMNNYRPLDTEEDGSLKVKKGKEVEYNKEKNTNVYKEFTLNSEALDASLVIIDEATSLSQMDAAMLDDFMEAKGIYGVYAGDFDQLGVSGKMEDGDGNKFLITQDITNYISTHKLGQVVRGNNSYKSNNVIGFKVKRANFINSLFNNGKLDPVNFSYYLDKNGVYGDIVTKADKIVDSSGTKYVLDQGTKDAIDIMINSLNEGEKINYIFDDPNSEMYKYLHDKYSDKINEISTKAAQSQEGQYYIVDVALKDNLSNDKNSPDLIKAVNQFKTLYTAMSRAKQATLIYDRGSNNETISNRLNSTRIDKLITTNIGQEARQKYADSRKTAIKKALNGENKTLSNDWKEDQFVEKTKNPVMEGKKDEDESNEEETPDSRTDVRNEPKEINIINDSEDSLNMMIHSFNTHEIGGIIDENGQLVLGERGTRINSEGKYIGERIDNANGIVKALKIPVDNDGKLSIEDTQKVLTILHKIRTAGLYEKTNGDIVSAIKDALETSENVSVRFMYKNSQQPDTLTSRGALSKFFNTVKEKLLYLFNGETDQNKRDKQETPPNRTIGLEIFVGDQQIEIPIGVFTSPATLVKTKGFEKLYEIYVQSGEKLTEFEKQLKIKKQNEENIPHLNSMLKLLEIYQWNYNYTTGKQNWVVRFKKDFALNSNNAKLTGVQTPPRERGKDYKDQDYWYPGRRLSLEDYRKEMPNRKISNIYENLDEDILDSDGNVALEHGIPFILVSDYYTDINERDLYKEYIKQITTPNSEPKITRVYVYIPTESIDYFLYNQQEALKRDPNQRASDLDGTTGNKLTTYRLLSFMLQNDSNFMQTYTDWINTNSSFNDEQKQQSLNRLQRMQDLLKYITDYESSLIPSYTEGSQSKQILQFLDKTPENLRSHPELLKILIGTDTQGWIGNMKQSLRTTLLQEFRKLLYSNNFYEGVNEGDEIKFPSPSLSGQDFQIVKEGNNYKYKDYQINRIKALKDDAAKNNWDGVMFHTSLEKESEMTVSQGSHNYRIAAINTQGATYISSRPIELNGKLDTTAVITDVEPMLDEILSKLVVSKDGSVCSTTTRVLSDAARQKLYEENTGAYLKGENPDNVIDQDKELLNKALNAIEPNPEVPMDVITQALKNFIDREGSNYTLEGLLNLTFYNTGHAVIKVGNNYKIIPLPENSERLIVLPNATYYLYDNKIWEASQNGKHTVSDPNILQELLNNNIGIQRDATRIIQNYIQELINSGNSQENEIDGQSLIDSTYAPGFIDFQELLDYDNESNKDTLIKVGALEIDPERKYNAARYLLNYVLKTIGKLDPSQKANHKEFKKQAKNMSDQDVMTILQQSTQNLDNLNKLLDLLDNTLNPKIDECVNIE